MDLMELRRGLMMGMAGLPKYLQHIYFVPQEDLRSYQFNVGEIHNAVLISDCPVTAPNIRTLLNGVFNFDANGIYINGSRVCCRNTDGSLTYYGATSGGGQSWTLENGVLTVLNTTGWVFAAGTHYDLFFW